MSTLRAAPDRPRPLRLRTGVNPADLVSAGLGLAALLLAGDALVRGAVNLALRVGVPALIVSLTIVAFGTSAPELLVSVEAVLEGAPGIALGNVVGSNTANVLLVLGVPALLTGLRTSGHDTRRTYLFMISGSILFVAIGYCGTLRWTHGLILLAAFAAILTDQAREAMRHRKAAARAENMVDEIESADPEMPLRKILFNLALGMFGLPLGAVLLVHGSVNIAEGLGVSERMIGLTLVAIGTSLPELSTTIMAAFRRQADVALGNVIGSNMFNLLAIVGTTTIFGAIPVAPGFLRFDFWVMLGASLLIAPFVFRPIDMSRGVGLILTLAYAAYVIVVLT